MAAADPFMTLVDAATALRDHSKTKEGNSKGSSSLQGPKDISETNVQNQTITPPPDDSDSEVKVILVSPDTPRASNRTVKKDPKESLKEASSFDLHLIHKKPLPFARVLMTVLMDSSLNDVITFLPDGDAFAILKPKTFAEEVMPKYFAIRTFSPFMRKLHRWGFERIMDKKTHDVDVFRHPLFIRGNLMLCDKIKCVGRLVKGPIEESILTAAGINSKSMGMPTHQELEIRSFVERTNAPNPTMPMMRPAALTNTTAQLLLQSAKQSNRRPQTQNSFIQQAQSSFRQQSQLRQPTLAQQALQRQAAESAAVNQILLASLNKNREEERRIKEELHRLTQEELLRQKVANALQQHQRQQQLSSDVASALQQARLRELLNSQRELSQVNSGNSLPVSLMLQAALEAQSSGRSVDSVAALRRYL
jgi:hypothetical protein